MLSILISTSFHSQNEYFVYCDNGVFDTIVKIDEISNGDTIVKTYKDPLFGDQTFSYHFYNDSIFSKHQGEYYLIGANQAEIGDIWQPLWHGLISYTDVDQECSPTRTLKVMNKEQIEIGNEFRMKYTLKIIDIDFDEFPHNGYEVYFSFIEGIGAINGGPFYNLTASASCIDCFDCPEAVFITYYNGENNYDGGATTCSTSDIDLIAENDTQITYKIINDVLYLEGTEENTELTIYNLIGEIIRSSSHNYISVNELTGIHLVQISHNGAINVQKIYF